MRFVREKGRRRQGLRWVAVALICVPLVSCGFGGDDDGAAEPTATEAALENSQAGVTAAATESGSSSTPESPFTMLPPSPVASPAMETPMPDGQSTPVAPGAATPIANLPAANGFTATPVPASSGRTDEPATEDLPTPTPVAQTGSDGTAGPGALPGTPASAATPAASPVAGSGVALVDSCDVPDAPPFTGDTETWQVTTGLNFRSGPGADCDAVQAEPLQPGTAVTVLSDPVVREDLDDGTEWVEVDVNGQVGWVAAEFIEPVP